MYTGDSLGVVQVPDTVILFVKVKFWAAWKFCVELGKIKTPLAGLLSTEATTGLFTAFAPVIAAPTCIVAFVAFFCTENSLGELPPDGETTTALITFAGGIAAPVKVKTLLVKLKPVVCVTLFTITTGFCTVCDVVVLGIV